MVRERQLAPRIMGTSIHQRAGQYVEVVHTECTMPIKSKRKFLPTTCTLAVILLGLISCSTVIPDSEAANRHHQSYGNYLRPYAANSLWNSRPVNPVFDSYVIPKAAYFPSINAGAYSTGVFLASPTDKPMTVVGRGSTETAKVGVADPDNGPNRVITIPHWPADVLPAAGTDGHADIVDPVTKIVHSFWQLKQNNGQWTAALYSWSDISGSGWGDPAHYYQGARAVGIPASAGLIRKHEIHDGLPYYAHALAMSLAHNALSNGVTGPAYVFPATSADGTLSHNTGSIPEGALLMLPPDFDSNAIANPDLMKIVETLKRYGAYVVDSNDGTPFTINVETGSNFNIMPHGWDNKVASQMDLIRANLRQVVSAEAWIDGNGTSVRHGMRAPQNRNLLSMRGPWQAQQGSAVASYDSVKQRLVFEPTTTKAVAINARNTGITPVKWALPKPGTPVSFKVIAEGGATLRLQVSANSGVLFDSKDLEDGQSARFEWPANARFTLIASSGTTGASSVKAELVPTP